MNDALDALYDVSLCWIASWFQLIDALISVATLGQVNTELELHFMDWVMGVDDDDAHDPY